MSPIEAGLKAENEELKRKLSQSQRKIKSLNQKCESYEDRIENFVSDRSDLLDSIRVLESLNLEVKQFDIEQMQINENRLNHRVSVTKNLLDEARLKIQDLENHIASLDNELKDTKTELSNLKEKHKTTIMEKDQEIYSLESRLDITYTKLSQLKYTLDEFNDLSFWDRLKNNKPASLDDIDI